MSASSTLHGRRVDPQRLRQTGPLEQLARWKGPATLARHARRLSDQIQSGLSKSSPAPTRESGNDEDEWEAADDWVEAASVDVDPNSGLHERVLAADWVTEQDDRHLLLLAYANGLQVWRAAADASEAAQELLNLRLGDRVLAARIARCNDAPCIAYATLLDKSQSRLSFQSLRDEKGMRTTSVAAQIVGVRLNARVVAVVCTDPSSIRLFSTATLEPCGAPILDVPLAPIVALSEGRLLAYASTTRISSANIVARDGRWNTPDTNRQSETLDIGGVARRMVVAGVKSIGEVGLAYLSGKSAVSTQSAPLAGVSSPRVTEQQSVSVKVIDVQTMRTISSFQPTDHLALLSFNPVGTMLLTSSSAARSFRIFELSGAPDLSVWHRYDLVRGSLPGRAVNAAWSPDGRFVAVSMSKGTIHLYAISPHGGHPEPTSLFASNVASLPLIVFACSFILLVYQFKAKTAPVVRLLVRNGTVVSPSEGPACSFWISKAGYVQLALYYSHLGSLILERLQPATSGDGSVLPSGLSQLLRQQFYHGHSAVTVQHVAAWSLQRTANCAEVWSGCAEPHAQKAPSVGPQRYAAQAELQTFSRHARVNPASIYTSHQFEFFVVPLSAARSKTCKGDLGPHETRRLELRRHVDITRPLETSHLLDALSGSGIGTLSPHSRSPPSFPNAIAGVRGPPLWHRALPALSSQQSVSTSSPSTTQCSVSFEEDSVLTPATEPVQQMDDDLEDQSWGFDDLHVVADSVPKVHPGDGPFLMDEQHRERPPSLQPPIETVGNLDSANASSAAGKKKRRRSPMARSPNS